MLGYILKNILVIKKKYITYTKYSEIQIKKLLNAL